MGPKHAIASSSLQNIQKYQKLSQCRPAAFIPSIFGTRSTFTSISRTGVAPRHVLFSSQSASPQPSSSSPPPNAKTTTNQKNRAKAKALTSSKSKSKTSPNNKSNKLHNLPTIPH